MEALRGAGIGLRAQHHEDVLREKPAVDWFEVHSENFFADGGPHIRQLMAIRADYALALHGVGMSLGSVDELNPLHLQRLKRAVTRFAPAFVSEHLCWSSVAGRYANDLLPLPYTDEACRHVAVRIAQLQDYLGRQILIENVSSYLDYPHSQMQEWEFLCAVVESAGCGLLLDLNNLYVNAQNHGFCAQQYLTALPLGAVQEMHLAGHAAVTAGSHTLLLDTHAQAVSEAVWGLFDQALARFGPVPTLIEWDKDIPALAVLEKECYKIRAHWEGLC